VTLIDKCVKAGKVCKTSTGKCVGKDQESRHKNHTLMADMGVMMSAEHAPAGIEVKSSAKPSGTANLCGRTVWEKNCCNPETPACGPNQKCSASSGTCVSEGTFTRAKFKEINPIEIEIGGRTIVGSADTIRKLSEIFGKSSKKIPGGLPPRPPVSRVAKAPEEESVAPPPVVVRRVVRKVVKRESPKTGEVADIDAEILQLTTKVEALQIGVTEFTDIIDTYEAADESAFNDQEEADAAAEAAEMAMAEREEADLDIRKLVAQIAELNIKKEAAKKEAAEKESAPVVIKKKPVDPSRMEAIRARLAKKREETEAAERAAQKASEEASQKASEETEVEEEEAEVEEEEAEVEEEEEEKEKGKLFVEAVVPKERTVPKKRTPQRPLPEDVVVSSEQVAVEPSIEEHRNELRRQFEECIVNLRA